MRGSSLERVAERRRSELPSEVAFLGSVAKIEIGAFGAEPQGQKCRENPGSHPVWEAFKGPKNKLCDRALHHPPVHRRVVNVHSTLGHEFLDVPVAQLVLEVPAH
jgi:hypothetical protein